ncbi:hypothetical protein LCGC14_0888470 [marine sediment metagenome]|uniref:Uncharacterized protein n=1 Tax=marine sediment metagenome TaxID=412755 RepID=A0A0F9P4R2_9ZZZZ
MKGVICMAKQSKRRGNPPPKDETKEARFIRVCSMRVKKAVKAINNICNCAGSNYVYAPQHVVDIVAALDEARDNVSKSFESKGKTTTEFNFKSE